MQAFFQDGKPGRITADDFKRKYLSHFPDLADAHDDILEDAIDAVYVQFHGVQTLWDLQEKQVWFDKTRLCFLHLTAWFLADLYPELVSGVPDRISARRPRETPDLLISEIIRPSWRTGWTSMLLYEINAI